LSDCEWNILKHLLKRKGKRAGRPRELDMRQVVNAIFYVLRTGCAWGYLPKEYPNFNSVYYHYRRWSADGTWERVNSVLSGYVRHKAKRQSSPSVAIIDSQSVKSSQVGGPRGYDGGKKINGRKRHLLVDTLGNILKAVVHPANIQDRDGAKLLLETLPQQLKQRWTRLERIWADAGYNGDLRNWMHTHCPSVVIELVYRPSEATGFVLLPKRWVVERTFAWLGLYRRLCRDYERLLHHSVAMIYLASIRRFLRLLATAD
jgi:putative transposase